MKHLPETQRLIHREILPEDVHELFDLESDPEVHTYIGNHPLKTLQEVEQVIAYVRRQYQENGIGRCAVIEKATGNFLGWSGLKYEKEIRPGFFYYDVGYRFKKRYWGKGFATESAIASVAYGFQILQVDAICGAAHIENIASNKVLQKAGLKWVESFVFDGAPHHFYRIAKEDWQSEPSV